MGIFYYKMRYLFVRRDSEGKKFKNFKNWLFDFIRKLNESKIFCFIIYF